jgi:hypothetical protein
MKIRADAAVEILKRQPIIPMSMYKDFKQEQETLHRVCESVFKPTKGK